MVNVSFSQDRFGENTEKWILFCFSSVTMDGPACIGLTPLSLHAGPAILES